MAALYGYAINLEWTDQADHTYVTSSDGFAWPCWGRSSGGRMVCGGGGSSLRANCLSELQAFLIYGVNGVCHQAANRILAPASWVTVSGAKGYWASVGAYGPYGTNVTIWMPRLAYCNTLQGDRRVRAKASGARRRRKPDEEFPQEPGELEYLQNVRALHEEFIRAGLQRGQPVELLPPDMRSQEFELLLDYRLGARGAADQRRAVVDIHREAIDQLEQLNKKLVIRSVDGETFAARANSTVGKMLQRHAKELGRDRFEQTYGIAPRRRFVLVDPRIARKHFPMPRG
jgi:hypothetical protein